MKLSWLVRTLAGRYGPAPRPYPTDPFELIVWENVAYLADDANRRKAFQALRRTVGTKPGQILDASPQVLADAGRRGILPEVSAEKLRTAAEIALSDFDGDLRAVLRRPVKDARRALRKFPGIGEPGAEKILLYTRSHPFLAPDSNALRVLVRCGLCREGKNYASTYAAARELAERELGADFDALLTARHVLRRHGQELCRRAAPECEVCPVRPACPFPG